MTYNHEEKSTYSVTVKADDDNGGTATVVVTITVTDVAEQPATPAKPTLAAVSSTSLTATWVKPGLNGGPDITGYNVNYRVSTATAWETFAHSGAGVTRTITGLTASTSYQVRVQAINGETPSAWSDPSEAVGTNTETTLSSDATLSSLELSRITLNRDFSSDYSFYSARVANSVSSTTVTTATTDDGASVVIVLNGTVASDGTVNLGLGNNIIEARVTSADGTPKTYYVLVNRAETSAGDPPSADATLSSLRLSGITLNPAFSSSEITYTASVANTVSSTTVTATATDPNASSVVIKRNNVVDSDGTVNLAVGANVITVEVTAEDGTPPMTYTVTVTRNTADAPLSSDATLRSLSLSGITLNPAFSSSEITYTASVANTVSSTTVAATATDPNASSVVIKRNNAVDSDGTVNLAVGANVITVEVTAEDGTPPMTYTVTVTRNTADAPLSSDATLSSLSLSGITLNPAFSSSEITYTASVANTVSSTTVTATATDPNASSVVIKRNNVVDSDGTVNLAVGANVITVEVTAEDGTPPMTYTVTVTRNTADAPLSSDATLRSLSLSGITTLNPDFDPAETKYSANVLNRVSSTSVTAIPNHTGASVTIGVQGMGSIDADGRVNLGVGPNIISARVTAADGTTTETYRVLVNRAEASEGDPLSSDATLSSLSLTGITLSPGFASDTYAYTASVTPTKNDSGATIVYLDASDMTLADADTSEIGHQVEVAEGDNVIKVKVTAADTTTTLTYTVTVNRPAAANNAPIFSLAPLTRSVAENTAANQNVGAVIPEAMDDDGDSLTYTMEGTDAASFTFDASARRIKTSAALDFEMKSSYSVTVKADDDNGGTATVVVTITVTDVDEQPATPAKPTLAAVSATSLTATWTKPGLNGGPDITGYNVNYRMSTATAWETFTHSGAGVTRTITGLTADTEYQVRVQALNGETPSAWSDPSEAVSTNTETTLSSDATLSSLSLSGITLNPAFSSSITSYTASVANTVSSTTVTATATGDGASAVITPVNPVSLDEGTNTITVVVTAEDGTTKTYTVTVNRAGAAPTITAVAVTSTPMLTSSGGSTPDTYGEGEDIEFTVTFNEAVEVTGDPQFGFSLAGARVADYDSGSGSERLTFVYTVLSTDQDDDGIWVGNHASSNKTLQLDAGDAITSLGGIDANLEHATLDRLDDHKVDGSRTVDEPVEPVEPLEVTLHLSDADGEVAEDAEAVTVTATVSPASATAFTVTVSASPVAPATDADFTLSTNRTLRFAANATASAGTVTIAPVDDGVDEPNQVVTVSGSASIEGVTGPDDVTLTILDDDPVGMGGICDRTQEIRDRILVLLQYVHSFKGGCGDVNETHLAKLEALDLGRNQITEFPLSLQSHDFEGLVNLERLYLRDTGLRSLPAGVFADLQSLQRLELQKNPLVSLPYDEFEALPNLTLLWVDHPEGSRGYQVAGGKSDATVEVAAGGTTTYQVRLTYRPSSGTAQQPTLTVSSDTAGVVATPATLRFTRENWFRRQTVTVSAPSSAAGTTATLTHTSVAVTLDWPIPKVTVRVLESDTSRSEDPLTAAFEGLPSSHDGETAFTFRIVFSEAVSVTPEAMRTRVLTVEGSAVTGSARVDGESGVWDITVTPDTREALSISLPPAADCDADGAVCTSDGRALSIGAAHIVTGPADQPERNTVATGTPTIGGTPQVGETLTASTAGIADEDGLGNATFAYQWLADDAAIAGATGSTYTLVEADEGKTVKVRVSFTDDGGNDETLTSGATDAVAAPEPPAAPTGLSATPSHDRVVLTWDDPNDDTITGYVILRRNRDTDAQGQFTELAPDTSTAATTYTDDTVAAETPYTYRIKAINAHGTSERSRWFHIDTLAGPEPTQEPTPEPESVSEGDTDLPNDNSTPGRVAVGGSATGAIGTDGDQDRFAVELEAGRTYQFDLTGSPGGGGTLLDTFFRAIYDSEGQYQPDSYNADFEDGRDSRVTFTPTESGTYYARVSGDRDEVGSYTLSVTDVT